MTISKFAQKSMPFFIALCLALLMNPCNINIAQAIESENETQTNVGSALTVASEDDVEISTLATADATKLTLSGFKYNQTEARTMLDLVNNFRTHESWQYDESNTKITVPAMSALTIDAKLEQAAIQRAAECAIRYSHTRPDDSSTFTICDEVGYNYSTCGENIAFGYGSVESMFNGWKEENDQYDGQGHRRNMQNSDFNTIGIAYVEVNGIRFWAMELGKTATPSAPGNAFDGTRSVSMNILNDKFTGPNLTAALSSIDLLIDETQTLPTISARYDIKTQVVSGDYWNFSGATFAETVTPSWSVKDANIASITNGAVKGMALGTTTLTASASGKTADVSVTVWKEKPVVMYRLYNPNSGEHLYTKDENEYKVLGSIGWQQEGEAWQSPASGEEVYRLYNPNSGDHHYTMDANEYETLGRLGWNQEGVSWYSGGETSVYRLFNPNVTIGTHHYTIDENEYKTLQGIGWKAEGIGWYGC